VELGSMEIKEIQIGDIVKPKIVDRGVKIIVLGIRKVLGKDMIDGRYFNQETGKFVKEEFNIIEVDKV